MLSPKVDIYVKAYFDNRDIKFLVDNGSTMEPYWTEGVYLLETLVKMANPFDKDGMDLYFTSPYPPSVGSEDNFSKLALHDSKESAFRKAMLGKYPQKGVWTTTDITVAIKGIFREFFDRLEKTGRQTQKKSRNPWAKDPEKPKALTLIILTDDIWKAMKNPNTING
ncbi:hypothetical protein K458DRAFT_176777 [Lentithecium fluviatile CBS 122367]|uniref:Uncharacterized protein n=1 Tax=Lentithecium fluviatile CBS 122367 TaxID=1168545 RepID=A0A6G1JDK9_9PLEO|nr:hypothetical protein K458DRAFT_176777 [Lentithecium fluviatile CBS 122367]